MSTVAPRARASGSPPDAEAKPSWRGWIHAAATPVAIAAGIVLIFLAQGTAAKTGAAIFMATSIVLFGNSALYHRFDWNPRTRMVLKRIDHANIFLLIAGTYTPLALTALPLVPKGVALLCMVWGGALAGIAFRVFWISAPRWLYVPLYVLLGWAALFYIGDMVAASVAVVVLVFVGGGLYMLGAAAYGFKRPNPWPGRFGFHEIFHTLTVGAFCCHWIAMLILVSHPLFNA